MKKISAIRFDKDSDSSFRLGVDHKQSDQRFAEPVPSPHGSGKQVRANGFAEASLHRQQGACAELLG